EARAAGRMLRQFARQFPVGEPRAQLCAGGLAWLDGRPGAARAAWRRSLAAARRRAMPYDQALAHYELGRHARGPAWRRHLTRARTLFASLGAAYDVARVQALLAPERPG
ncbi:MAG TPA: hypothetical protein VKY74_17880, partial [Chloroflexia bacterium]|nr:hypothetical protein [Chloroflexia bacterium]